MKSSGYIELKGYKHNKVRIGPWDPKSRAYFEAEKKRVLKPLGAGFEMHHVGSTAVPGLGGKNITDILLLAPNKAKALSIRKTLEALGYVETKDAGDRYRLFLSRTARVGGRTVRIHLHLMWKTSSQYKEQFIFFRDYLIKHPSEAKRYYTLKKVWAKEANLDRRRYTELKVGYVREVIRKAKKELKVS